MISAATGSLSFDSMSLQLMKTFKFSVTLLKLRYDEEAYSKTN